jgi:hypothetical protein
MIADKAAPTVIAPIGRKVAYDSLMQVAFLMLGSGSIEQLANLDPDRDWREFQTGERAWILQTFLRLRSAGCAVELRNSWPERGLLVFDTLQRHALRRMAHSTDDVLLIGCRRDLGEPLIADFEVLQNGRFADGVRRYFVPHWPQPGLIPRDPARGASIGRIVYKGFSGNLFRGFLEPDWAQFLARLGVEWRCDSVQYTGPQSRPADIAWNDFRDADLFLAVRPPRRDGYVRKPATKLYNAWLAGVPAILGVEYAYRELRRSELDYLEVSSTAEARRAVERLIGEPRLYQAMVENGRERAAEFTTEAIRAQWVDLLFHTIPRHAGDAHVRRWRGKPLWLKSGVRRLTRTLGR